MNSEQINGKSNLGMENAFLTEWSTINRKRWMLKSGLYNFIFGEVRAFLTMLDLT